MLPPGMDGRAHNGGGSQDTSPGSATASGLEWPQTPGNEPRAMERASGSNLRSAFNRTNVPAQNTIRAVTPELTENGPPVLDTSSGFRGFGSSSPQSSPRSIPGGLVRRQGMVFNDAFGSSYDSGSSSPPPRQPTFRPRTHTMDGALRQHVASGSMPENRHRVGSFSSSGSTPVHDEVRPPAMSLESVGFPSATPARPPQIEIPTSTPSSHTLKEKKSSSRRLIKRQSSRPTSPLISPPPSVDSLPLPVPTDDANKVLLLMKNLAGRMRGMIEYQDEPNGSWGRGMCYIEEEKGSLMVDSSLQSGPLHITLVPDLRGCRILPKDLADCGRRCLEIVCPQPALELIIRPIAAEEFDLWLAALLCWQQLRPGGVKANGRGGGSAQRPEMKRRGSSNGPSKNASIIKVGKVLLWDKGLATSPRAIVKRPSTRDLKSPMTSWRRVSCILQDNGEFKLMTENDSSVLSVIELSQLSRCAVQQLDKTVLDEEYCIAIFPIYSSNSTQLSIFRPVYIAVDSRVHFEVWFVLLRAFAVPDIYAIDPSNRDHVTEVTDLEAEYSGEVFRVEKTINLRVTEAKMKPTSPPMEAGEHHHGKSSQDSMVGNYLAEVILDGEVRARTPTRPNTKNPFWREDVEFSDLPATLPFLSIVLKRVEGNLESLGHQLQASLGLPKTGNLTEVMCGAVDIPLDHLDQGKDHEQWLPIMDDRQQSIGTMMVKIHHEELVILLSKEYQPLSELLHRFPSGLTAQIAEVLPGNLRRLSEIFLNIFQVSGSAGEWLMALVEDEIDGIGSQASIKKYRFSNRLKSNESIDSASDRELIVRDMSKSLAGEANLLFRGNSLLTQSLEFHMRRLGKEYLEDILSEKVFEINELNPNCEVDPSKMGHGDDLSGHWSTLIQLTTEIWQCIAESATRLPPELRHILKYIRAVAEDRYGDFLRIVKYTSVSGFLFLRFICPAILSPKLFGMLKDHPRPRAQRTLTLVAKALQALANLSSFGKKEDWMEPMNKFLNQQRQSVKDYIDQVCSIPAERSMFSLPASYSTPITILGRLSPTAREGFPSLPYLVDHPRNFAALVKLWMDANPIGSGNLQRLVDGDLLIFNELCSELQKRADECLDKVEGVRTAEGTSAAATDDLVEQLEQAHLLDSLNLSIGNSSVWMESESLKPPGSSGSDFDPGSSERRSRDHRRGREASSLRNVSGQSDNGSAGGVSQSLPGTLRGTRNGGGHGGHGHGRTTRNILSGFMRMGRSDSPDASTSSPAARHGR
jgi:hypothetical protein